MATLMVVWSERLPPNGGRHADHADYWLPFNERAQADAQYKKVLQMPAVYTASICVVLESTDYEELV